MFIYSIKNYFGDLIYLFLINLLILFIYTILVIFFISKKILNLKISKNFLIIYFNILINFIKFFWFKLNKIDDKNNLLIIYLLKCIEQIFIKNHSFFWDKYKYKFLNIGLFYTAQNFQFLNFDKKLFFTYYMYSFVNFAFIIIEVYTYYYNYEELSKFIKYIFVEIIWFSFWFTIICITYFIFKKNTDIIYFHKCIDLTNENEDLIFKKFLFFIYLLDIFDFDNFYLNLEKKEIQLIENFHNFLLYKNVSFYSDYSDYIYYYQNDNFITQFFKK